jgi:hypothetical protein
MESGKEHGAGQESGPSADPVAGGERVLLVRLPCNPIFPLGPMYLADHLHKQFPGLPQRILDLAAVPQLDVQRVLLAHRDRVRIGPFTAVVDLEAADYAEPTEQAQPERRDEELVDVGEELAVAEAWLTVLKGPGEGLRFRLKGGRVTVGGAESRVVLPDPALTSSTSRHPPGSSTRSFPAISSPVSSPRCSTPRPPSTHLGSGP